VRDMERLGSLGLPIRTVLRVELQEGLFVELGVVGMRSEKLARLLATCSVDLRGASKMPHGFFVRYLAVQAGDPKFVKHVVRDMDSHMEVVLSFYGVVVPFMRTLGAVPTALLTHMQLRCCSSGDARGTAIPDGAHGAGLFRRRCSRRRGNSNCGTHCFISVGQRSRLVRCSWFRAVPTALVEFFRG
jgi:hypothetical protein